MIGTKRIAVSAVLGLALALAGPPAHADGVYDLLRIDASPRGAALGGFPVALAKGEAASVWLNPAALAHAEGRQAGASFANHPLDLTSGMGVYGQPFYGGFAAAAVSYFSYGTFDRYASIDSPQDGTFNASDMVVALSYARPVWKGLSAGANVKYIRGQISDYTSSGAAVDLGLFLDPQWNGVTVAATVQNAGAQLEAYNDTSEPLPFVARFGASKKLEHLPLRLSGTAHYEQNEDLYFTGSGEFTVSEMLLLRVGYTTLGSDYRTGGGEDSLAGISGGIGITWRAYGFDYAFLSQGAAGQVHRFGVRAVFQ